MVRLWHGSLLLYPGSFRRSCFSHSKNLFPQYCGHSIMKPSFCLQSLFPSGIYSSFARSPGWEVYCGARTFTTGWGLLHLTSSLGYGNLRTTPWSGLMATSLQQNLYHMPRLPVLPLMPCPWGGCHCWLMPPQETSTLTTGLAQSLVGLTASFPGSWCTQVWLDLSKSFLVGDLISKIKLYPSTVFFCFTLSLHHWFLFFIELTCCKTIHSNLVWKKLSTSLSAISQIC